jgi:hypothetical protein
MCLDDGRIEYAATVLGVKPSTIHSYIKRGWLGSCCEEDVARLARLLNAIGRGKTRAPAIKTKVHRRTDLNNNAELLNRLKQARKACELCSSSENLQCHHILARRYGGSNDDSNLMLLCRDCHLKIVHRQGKYGIHTWAVEHGQIEPSQLNAKKHVLDKGFDDSADGTGCKSAACG